MVTGDLDEDDSCTPDLESVDQVPYHQDSRSTAQGPILGFAQDNPLLRNLAIAIRVRLFFVELNCVQDDRGVTKLIVC